MIIRKFTSRIDNRLKMNDLIVFTHPDPECSGSSLSARREGEEGELGNENNNLKLSYELKKVKFKMSENHTPISRARKLRKEMTEEEKLLWKYLRNQNH